MIRFEDDKKHDGSRHLQEIDGQTDVISFNGHHFTQKVSGINIPGIFFTEKAMLDQGAIVALCKDEVSWFGTVTEDADGDLIIDEMFVPEQEVSGASADVDEDGMVKMAEEILKRDDGIDVFNKLRYFCHSHVTMGTGPSGTDEEQAADFAKQCDDFLIRGICNKHGRLELTLFLFKPGIKVEDAKWGILQKEETAQAVKFWHEELGNKLHGWRSRNKRISNPAYNAANSYADMWGPGWNDEDEVAWTEEWQRRANATANKKRILSEVRNLNYRSISYKNDGEKLVVLQSGEHIIFDKNGVERQSWFDGTPEPVQDPIKTVSDSTASDDDPIEVLEDMMLQEGSMVHLDSMDVDEIALTILEDEDDLEALGRSFGVETPGLKRSLQLIWKHYPDCKMLMERGLMPLDGSPTWSERADMKQMRFTDEEISLMAMARRQAIALNFVSQDMP